jgi:WD40 repeat protein
VIVKTNRWQHGSPHRSVANGGLASKRTSLMHCSPPCPSQAGTSEADHNLFSSERYSCSSVILGGVGQGRLRWHSRTTDLGWLSPVNVTTEDFASGETYYCNSIVADRCLSSDWALTEQPASRSDHRVFDTHTGSERTVGAQHTIADAHRSLIYEIAWSPDDAELVTSSADNTVIWPLDDPIMAETNVVMMLQVRVWDAVTWKSLALTEFIHPCMVYTARFQPEGTEPRIVASGGLDGLLRLWDRDSAQILMTLSTSLVAQSNR